MHSPPLAVRLDVRAASGSYAVEIAPGAAGRLKELLDAIAAPARRVFVSNPAIWRLHSDVFRGVSDDEPILIPDGERFKHTGTVSRIYDALVRMSADRATTIVALGGGIVGDVAGFAAATFLRGVALVHVPTTLLAQVDSAIGGKVGVNHALGKNLIGAFYPPLAVVIDPLLLATLPRREFRAGLYEVVKYGVIASRPLFDRIGTDLPRLFAREAEALLPVVAESCRIKAAVVEQDEKESGPRRTLNFGHTVGHALEAITKYRRFRHGEAIAYGMLAAAEIGVAKGAMPPADRDALATLIVQMGPLPAVADLSAAQALEAIGRDKKIVAGRLHFVLAPALGRTDIVTGVTMDEIAAALKRIGLKA